MKKILLIGLALYAFTGCAKNTVEPLVFTNGVVKEVNDNRARVVLDSNLEIDVNNKGYKAGDSVKVIVK